MKQIPLLFGYQIMLPNRAAINVKGCMDLPQTKEGSNEQRYHSREAPASDIFTPGI
jgi:hypothetical protein